MKGSTNKFTPEQIITYFEQVPSVGELKSANQSGEISMLCPLHNDSSDSFSLNPEKGWWKCHSINCPSASLTNNGGGSLYDFEMCLADVDFKEAQTNVFKTLNITRQLSRTYTYRDISGADAFFIERYEWKASGLPISYRKEFQAYHLIDGKRVNRRPDHLCLYNLPSVAEADTVMVVEGEKCADVVTELLKKHGLQDIIAVTCNPFGAGKWKAVYSQCLKNKKVYVVPDHDVAGYKHAKEIISSIRELAETLVIKVPLKDIGADIVDYLAMQDDPIAAFMQLVDGAKHLSPEKLKEDADQLSGSEPTESNTDKMSDLRAGELFAGLHKDQVRYDHQQQRWLLWTGQHWEEDITNRVAVMAQQAVRGHQSNESKNKISNALWFAGNQQPISVHCENDGWNQAPWLLAVGNGVVDLKTGELREGTQADKITVHTDINFNSHAECPTWMKFLSDVFVDSELTDFIWKAVGYSITGSIAEQVFFVCYGTGSNGKGIFLQTLRHALGEYGQNAASGTFEHGKGQSIPSDLARLVDRRFVVSSEVGKEARFNEQRLKSVSHGDRQSARFLGKDFFEFTPQTKIWFAVNHRPKVNDESIGFWRSVRLIPFTQQFMPQVDGQELPEGTKMADPDLADKLKGEAEGILKWCVEGCLKYQKEGLKPPDRVLAATKEYELDSDIFADFFSDKCEFGKSLSSTGSELFNAYSDWAIANSVPERERLSHAKFGREMKSRFKKTTPQNVATYHGIGVRKD